MQLIVITYFINKIILFLKTHINEINCKKFKAKICVGDFDVFVISSSGAYTY